MLGSLFEKQVIEVDKDKEIINVCIQNGSENYEKVIPGRPKSRPWSDHGSDALSGPPVSVWRGGLFPTFRSLFEDCFRQLFNDVSETTFLMEKIDFLKTGVSPRREHHF